MFWYLEALKKYAVFGGRARRREYWFFFLVNGIISILLSVIDSSFSSPFDADAGFGALSGIYTVAVLLPGLSVGVRRLHDTGKSGWWLLICLVPFVGVIVLLVFLIMDGEPEENQYGPNPKAQVGSAPEQALDL